MDAEVHDHDEASSLRKSRTRFRDTLRLIRPELENPGSRRFLDVGGGQVAWLVAPCFPGRTFAADLSGVFAAESERLGVPMRVWNIIDGDAPFEAASFDLVAFTEVLEHLPPPPFPYLRRIGRLVRPGGVLLFSVPNLAAFWKRWKFLLFGRSPLKLGERYHDRAGIPDHIREYTVAEVRHLLAACGFEIERLRTGDYGHGWRRRATTVLHRLTPGWGRCILVRARKPAHG
jgi:SAM-dependent methyltransferase